MYDDGIDFNPGAYTCVRASGRYALENSRTENNGNRAPAASLKPQESSKLISLILGPSGGAGEKLFVRGRRCGVARWPAWYMYLIKHR